MHFFPEDKKVGKCQICIPSLWNSYSQASWDDLKKAKAKNSALGECDDAS